MSRQFEMFFHSEPFWLYEAFACMNYVSMLDDEEWMNKSSWSRQEKEEFLAPYRNYRETMRSELQPILAQYPRLTGYVDSAPRDQDNRKSQEPPIILFLMELQYILEAEEMLSEEKLETELNLAFQRMLENSIQDSSDEEEPVISELSDMMTALERWEGTDADKFKMLRLYSERHEVMEQLWSIKGFCRETGRKCLKTVQERFEACMEELKKSGTIENFLEKTGIQCEGKYSCQIIPIIMWSNRIIIQIRELQEKPGYFKMKLFIGIEIFCLHHFAEADQNHDNRLLARLKALGDPTRLKILYLLVERPWYLQEMAKALGLTSATVLHHLGVLVTEELVELQVEAGKKKIYYQLRKQGLREVSQGILQLAMSREEREAQFRQQMQEGKQSQGGMQWLIQK